MESLLISLVLLVSRSVSPMLSNGARYRPCTFNFQSIQRQVCLRASPNHRYLSRINYWLLQPQKCLHLEYCEAHRGRQQSGNVQMSNNFFALHNYRAGTVVMDQHMIMSPTWSFIIELGCQGFKWINHTQSIVCSTINIQQRALSQGTTRNMLRGAIDRPNYLPDGSPSSLYEHGARVCVQLNVESSKLIRTFYLTISLMYADAKTFLIFIFFTEFRQTACCRIARHLNLRSSFRIESN